MSITLYIYSKCSTCKNALSFLDALGLKPDIKEINVAPPSLAELEAMLGYQGGNVKKLFNVSGNLYRAMHLAEKLNTMSIQQSLHLLSSHGMLVKRPFLIGQDFGLAGFNEKQWRAQLART